MYIILIMIFIFFVEQSNLIFLNVYTWKSIIFVNLFLMLILIVVFTIIFVEQREKKPS
jgi:hypothetical protein